MNRRKTQIRLELSRMASLLMLFLVVQISFSTPIHAQCQYEVVATITGPEICGPNNFASFGTGAVSESGIIAGGFGCNSFPTAALWMSGAIALPLSGPPSTSESMALDLFDADHIVGIAIPIGQVPDVAAYWEFGQGRLLDLPPGADASRAQGINLQGQIVGWSNNTSFGPLQSILWEDDELTILNLPRGPNSGANGINSLQQITGWMGDSDTADGHAYIWDNGIVTDLGVIPEGDSAIGLAINNQSHVVGRGWVPDALDPPGHWRAIYWDGLTMIDLGTLPDHKRSFALDINDHDQIVGYSTFVGMNPNIGGAVMWQEGVLYKLQDLVVTDLGGFDLIQAKSINNKGWIISDTGVSVILLKPLGSAPGDIDNNCVVNVADLLILLSEWGNTSSNADVNEDGIVNVLDLLDLLADWG